MENGVRIVISSNPATSLPNNNLNSMVQELKLGQTVSKVHNEEQMQQLSQLKTFMQSVDDLHAKAAAI